MKIGVIGLDKTYCIFQKDLYRCILLIASKLDAIATKFIPYLLLPEASVDKCQSIHNITQNGKRPTQMIQLKLVTNHFKLYVDYLEWIVTNLSEIILIISFHFKLYNSILLFASNRMIISLDLAQIFPQVQLIWNFPNRLLLGAKSSMDNLKRSIL